jgi:23S rRNA pseudouridine1911/1915/1917 synthase
VQEGLAEVDGRVVRPSQRLRAGQQIRFHVPAPEEAGPQPEPIPLEVLFEDDGLIVINKPAGMVVHPARGHWSGTLTSALAYHFQALSDIGGPARPGIVHRLDRDTSGVILVAKSNAVHIHLAAQFEARTVNKTYLAIVSPPPDRDRDWIDQPIGLHPFQRDKMAIRAGHSSSREAQTFYEVQSRLGNYALLKLSPKTGRTHQLRVHLDFLGVPILCDRLYAGRSQITLSELSGKPAQENESPILTRQALHAHQLEFDHPQSGKRLSFVAPLPADLEGVLLALQSTALLRK